MVIFPARNANVYKICELHRATQATQGYIFLILQQFETKLCNFTHCNFTWNHPLEHTGIITLEHTGIIHWSKRLTYSPRMIMSTFLIKNCFRPSTVIQYASVFKSFRFQSRFRKALFSLMKVSVFHRISVERVVKSHTKVCISNENGSLGASVG